ncbi:glycosyltransferase [uncultured Sphingomonas sp.]|uniref:glycosyltransferase n=1 Tax=uncultured Sphingomonas sp. TaxID=158754 RepID=UPI0035CA3516
MTALPLATPRLPGDIDGAIDLACNGLMVAIMQRSDDEDLRDVGIRSLQRSTLLLVLPLPVYGSGENGLIDRQAHNGIHRWLDNFNSLIICMPALGVEVAPADVVALRESDFDGRVRVIRLPNSRAPLSFARSLRGVSAILDELVDQSTHLSFAIGGLFGDWAAIAALRAHRKGRTFSIWTDRVESEVTRFHASTSRGVRRIYWSAIAFAMKRYERLIVRRATIGLFHGADCYAAYARFSRAPHLVHDIHLGESDRIAPAELDAKIARPNGPLRIIYAGRAHAEKGIFDWIETLSTIARRGVEFTAHWYGDGPALEAARVAVSSAGLDQSIFLPGAIYDRELLLRKIREADIFLFCHKTPESPRCLVEALISGTPIVGYDSAYPRDLIKRHQGGMLTEGEPQRLADVIERLAIDRSMLASLIRTAGADGHPFNDTEVFRHRSDLIKAAT